jgi:tRNA1(Val) A37 N6-methylase TrmN6
LSAAERAQNARYEARHAIAREPIMLGIERCVCGYDYGADSRTTQSEADRLARHLELDETKRLIDLGAGAGWPGLHLAKRCACATVLADLPLAGIRIATDRIHTDGMQDRVVAVEADAAKPPFADRCVRESACHVGVRP